MKKILFLIPNLSVGGAEKVLVNLVNNMDKEKFDITVQVLFAGGVNEKFLKPHIKYKYCYRVNLLFCLIEFIKILCLILFYYLDDLSS